MCVCCVKGALARGVSERRAYLVNVETSDAQSSQSLETSVARDLSNVVFRPGERGVAPAHSGWTTWTLCSRISTPRASAAAAAARPRASAGARLRPSAGPPPSPARQRRTARLDRRRSPRHVRRTRAGTRRRNRRGTSTSSTISSGSSTPSWGPAYRPCRNDRWLRQPRRHHHHHQNLIITHPPRSRPINPRRPMRTPRAYPRPWTGAATAATAAAAAAARHSWPTPARRRRRRDRAAGSTGALHART